MDLMRLFFLSFLISGFVLQTSGFAESEPETVTCAESEAAPEPVFSAQPVICDPLQEVCIKMEIAIEAPILASLQEMGVMEMTLTPAIDGAWSRTFPVENGTIETFSDKADPLSLNFEDGILVTYATCEGDKVYAFCQVQEDLKGQYPAEMRLNLNPILGECNIEVFYTQCP